MKLFILAPASPTHPQVMTGPFVQCRSKLGFQEGYCPSPSHGYINQQSPRHDLYSVTPTSCASRNVFGQNTDKH